jgi:hypothetical protein
MGGDGRKQIEFSDNLGKLKWSALITIILLFSYCISRLVGDDIMQV